MKNIRSILLASMVGAILGSAMMLPCDAQAQSRDSKEAKDVVVGEETPSNAMVEDALIEEQEALAGGDDGAVEQVKIPIIETCPNDIWCGNLGLPYPPAGNYVYQYNCLCPGSAAVCKFYLNTANGDECHYHCQ